MGHEPLEGESNINVYVPKQQGYCGTLAFNMAFCFKFDRVNTVHISLMIKY